MEPMVAIKPYSKSASQDRLRIVLIVVIAPIVLVLSLSGVGLVHSYNIFCWNGIDVTHYRDGQVELETTYLGGLRHGRQTKYHPNGKKMIEREFQEGKLQGLCSIWDSEGRLEEETEYDDFTYVWDQASYDPVTGDYHCHIHFRFADGSEMNRAFAYDWRLWSVPEVRELLAEAGFSSSTVYWEGSDEDGEGDGVFKPVEKGEADEAFVSYIVAQP